MKDQLKYVKIILSCLLVLFVLSGCKESDEAKYKRGQNLLSKKQYSEAALLFDELGSYEDAAKLSMYCKAANAGENKDYDTALHTFELLGDFKESKFMITYYTGRLYEDIASMNPEESWENWFKAIEYYDSLTVFMDCNEREENIRQTAYQLASDFAEKKDFETASKLLISLNGYKDSSFLSKYYEALNLEQKGLFKEASLKFGEISSFRDASDQVNLVLQRGYETAEKAEENGELDHANRIYLSLGDYLDSKTRAYEPYYKLGNRMLDEQEWDAAIEAFTKAGEYEDANKKILEVYYKHAELLYEEKDWERAADLFKQAGADNRAKEVYYSEGLAKREVQDWNGAKTAFELAEDYKDSKNQILETTYEQANSLNEQGEYGAAYKCYETIYDYKDVQKIVSDDPHLRELRIRPFLIKGNKVFLGRYWYSKYDDEQDISWIVLDVKDNKALLITEYVIDTCPHAYFHTDTVTGWEDSCVRSYLKSFPEKRFPSWVSQAIVNTVTGVDKDGNSIEDRVFILSEDEIKLYFPDDNSRLCKPTPYAAAESDLFGKIFTYKGNCAWWTRPTSKSFSCVHSHGYFSSSSSLTDHEGIRPALWLDLDLY